jgi:putative endonuclease
LKKRVKQHQAGLSFATSYRGPWTLIYYEAYLEEAVALGRERYLKSGGGRRLLRMQLRNYFRNRPIRSETQAEPSTA